MRALRHGTGTGLVIVQDAELTPYGELFLGNQNDECEFCGRSMISRFGGIVSDNECPSCRADFQRLNAAGKLEVA